MCGKSARPLASGRLLGALMGPACPGDPYFLALCAQVGPLSGLSAHFGVMQDHIFFDGEAFSLMAPLNMDPKVSAKRPSHPPQPHPLLTFALPLAPYFVPSGRLWQSIFFGRFTLFDGFNGETAPCSMGLQTFSLRGVVYLLPISVFGGPPVAAAEKKLLRSHGCVVKFRCVCEFVCVFLPSINPSQGPSVCGWCILAV